MMLYTKHGRRYRLATADEVLEAAAKYLVAIGRENVGNLAPRSPH